MKISVNRAIAWLVVFALATLFFRSHLGAQTQLAPVIEPVNYLEHNSPFTTSYGSSPVVIKTNDPSVWELTHLWYSFPNFEIAPKVDTWFTVATSVKTGNFTTAGDSISAGNRKRYGIKFNSTVVVDSFHYQLVGEKTTLTFTTEKDQKLTRTEFKALPLVREGEFYMFLTYKNNPRPFNHIGHLYVDVKNKNMLYQYDTIDSKTGNPIKVQIYWGDSDLSNWKGLLDAYTQYCHLLNP